MSDVHRKPGDVLALATMGPDDPERVAFEAHAAECPSCRAEWQRAQRLAALMGTLAPPPPPSPKPMARTQARVRALLAAEPRLPVAPARSALPAVAVGAAVLVSVVVAFAMSGPAISAYRVVLAAMTVAVAALLPTMALRSDRDALRATAIALGASVVLAWVDFAEFPLVAGHTVGCMQIELAVGALPLLTMLAMARGSGPRPSALRTAAAGACGALAGQGFLLTSCAADESVLHVLLFHAAGVALAALLGGGLGRLAARAV